MVNTIEELAEKIAISIINNAIIKNRAESLIIWLGERKDEYEKQKVEVKKNLEQTKNPINLEMPIL